MATLRVVVRLVKYSLVVLVGVLLLTWAGWEVSGGRLCVVTSPSMSPVDPVGTLIAIRPTTGPLKVGELVAVKPPGQSLVYTHDIAQVLPGGLYRTRGILNANDDSWTVSIQNIEGVAVFHMADLGWILTSIPIWASLALGVFFLVWFFPGFAGLFFSLGWMLAVLIPIWLYHPLVNAQMVTYFVNHGEIQVYMVSTGALNAWVHMGGNHLLHAGHTLILHATAAAGKSTLYIPLRVALYWWQWMIVGLVCALPGLCGLYQMFFGEDIPEDLKTRLRHWDRSGNGREILDKGYTGLSDKLLGMTTGVVEPHLL